MTEEIPGPARHPMPTRKTSVADFEWIPPRASISPLSRFMPLLQAVVDSAECVTDQTVEGESSGVPSRVSLETAGP